jgi:hypothetical protein
MTVVTSFEDQILYAYGAVVKPYSWKSRNYKHRPGKSQRSHPVGATEVGITADIGASGVCKLDGLEDEL